MVLISDLIVEFLLSWPFTAYNVQINVARHGSASHVKPHGPIYSGASP